MKLFLISLFLLPVAVASQLKVAKIFSDNMVLQRDMPVRIWGKGIPGKTVTILFGKETRHASIKTDSSWMVEFTNQKANESPQLINITSGEDKIELKNILVGDLWLCMGQSNMLWPVQLEMHFKNEIQYARQPMLRFYNPTYAGQYIFGSAFSDSVIQLLNTKSFYKGEWQQSDSNSFKTMSAVGYYFGKTILASENIPIGLIDLAIGGAPIETFISKAVLQKNPVFANKLQNDWLGNTALPFWTRERATQNIGNKSNVVKDELGPNHAFKPGFAFASGIEPILSLPIKGIIWYQGESNAEEIERVNEYGDLLKLMINDYRKRWQQPDLPFYWVQLSSIERQFWPQFRDMQRRLLGEIKNGGMAVCSDIGARNDVHPTNKKDVGERLARWALSETYHKKIVPSGPLPLQAKYINKDIVITFQYTANGLKTSDGEPVKGFSINGQTEVRAEIRNNTIVIPVPDKPAFVYYAYKPFTDANLVNSESLPASTFKIEVD